MSSNEINQSSRREFLTKVAKTGALAAPIIATFALTSGSPVQARNSVMGRPTNQLDIKVGEDYLEYLEQRGKGELPNTK